MNDNLSNFLFGAIGGGVVATGFRVAETYLIAPRFTESLEARKKLFLYASPLSHASHELRYRLHAIHSQLPQSAEIRAALSHSPRAIASIDWFTKTGYFITSTAYLISLTSAWIQLYERDVVFLKFGRKSLTRQFFKLIEQFKTELSSRSSILWFYYINGLGEQLIHADKNRPLAFSEFTYKLYQDPLFRDYYDQLFVFLNQVGNGEHLDTIRDTLRTLEAIHQFLEQNRITIPMQS